MTGGGAVAVAAPPAAAAAVAHVGAAAHPRGSGEAEETVAGQEQVFVAACFVSVGRSSGG